MVTKNFSKRVELLRLFVIISGYNVINTEYINTYETRIEMLEAKNLSCEGLRNNKKGGVIPMGEDEDHWKWNVA